MPLEGFTVVVPPIVAPVVPVSDVMDTVIGVATPVSWLPYASATCTAGWVEKTTPDRVSEGSDMRASDDAAPADMSNDELIAEVNPFEVAVKV